MNARPPDAPSRVLADRFELLDVLGQGGMATVWSAHDRRLDRQVAVKLLRPDLPPEQAMRIEREARAAARINDPHVVAVLDLDHTPEGTPFLVMQAHGGHTLANDLQDGPLPRARVDRLVDDIVGALAAAHAEGVLHRDLKPSNILSDPDGFRLTDFGIASLDDDLETNGDLVGTLAYIAPERFDGLPATARSDVFSLGVVLHEAITGRQPFRGDSPGDTMRRLRLGIAEPLPPGTDPSLAGMVSSALQADPAGRPADGGAMLAALAVDLHAPTEPVHVVADPTERLDHTAVLRTVDRPDAPPRISAPRIPDLGEKFAEAGAAITPAARRGATIARQSANRFRALSRDNPPAAIAIGAAALLVFVLLLTIFVPRGTDSTGTEPAPSDAPPAVQLDANLDRIEELGR